MRTFIRSVSLHQDIILIITFVQTSSMVKVEIFEVGATVAVGAATATIGAAGQVITGTGTEIIMVITTEEQEDLVESLLV